jgi:hypothetical protein
MLSGQQHDSAPGRYEQCQRPVHGRSSGLNFRQVLVCRGAGGVKGDPWPGFDKDSYSIRQGRCAGPSDVVQSQRPLHCQRTLIAVNRHISYMP